MALWPCCRLHSKCSIDLTIFPLSVVISCCSSIYIMSLANRFNLVLVCGVIDVGRDLEEGDPSYLLDVAWYVLLWVYNTYVYIYIQICIYTHIYTYTHTYIWTCKSSLVSQRCFLTWISLLQVLVVGFSSDIGYALGDTKKHCKVYRGARWHAAIVYVLGFWLLDFSNNAVQVSLLVFCCDLRCFEFILLGGEGKKLKIKRKHPEINNKKKY